jgi:hypothetical protein
MSATVSIGLGSPSCICETDVCIVGRIWPCSAGINVVESWHVMLNSNHGYPQLWPNCTSAGQPIVPCILRLPSDRFKKN